MNYRYGIITAALCGILTLPALAAVTDIDDGGSTESKTVINNIITDHQNHYKTNEATKTEYVKDGAKRVSDDSSPDSYEVKGTLNYWEMSAHQHGTKGNYWYTNESNTQNYSLTGDNLSSLQNQIENSMKGYVYQAQPSGRDTSYSQGSWSMTNVSDNRSHKTGVETYNKTYRDDYTKYSEVSHKDVKTGSHTYFTGVTTTGGGSGFVAVGDPDDLVGTGYIASGHATYNYRQDDYYTRHHYFERTHTAVTIEHQRDYDVKTGRRVVTYEITGSRSYSPIVLDLDGDGKIEASNGQYLIHSDVSNHVAMFDYYGNGYPVVTEWVGAHDGLLCRPSADGTVNGTNLFGTANGFENGYDEMAAYDTNKDGQLSGEELNDLRVWTDVNSDAVAQPSELKTLAELGITSLSVSHNNYKSSFVRNGQTYDSFDWWPTFSDTRKVDLAAIVTK